MSAKCKQMKVYFLAGLCSVEEEVVFLGVLITEDHKQPLSYHPCKARASKAAIGCKANKEVQDVKSDNTCLAHQQN